MVIKKRPAKPDVFLIQTHFPDLFQNVEEVIFMFAKS
jgi:hypothetical protein